MKIKFVKTEDGYDAVAVFNYFDIDAPRIKRLAKIRRHYWESLASRNTWAVDFGGHTSGRSVRYVDTLSEAKTEVSFEAWKCLFGTEGPRS